MGSLFRYTKNTGYAGGYLSFFLSFVSGFFVFFIQSRHAADPTAEEEKRIAAGKTVKHQRGFREVGDKQRDNDRNNDPGFQPCIIPYGDLICGNSKKNDKQDEADHSGDTERNTDLQKLVMRVNVLFADPVARHVDR